MVSLAGRHEGSSETLSRLTVSPIYSGRFYCALGSILCHSCSTRKKKVYAQTDWGNLSSLSYWVVPSWDFSAIITTLKTLQQRRPEPCIPSCPTTSDYKLSALPPTSLQLSVTPLISISWNPIEGTSTDGGWCGVQGVMCSKKEQVTKPMLHWTVSCNLGTLATLQEIGQPLGLQSGHGPVAPQIDLPLVSLNPSYFRRNLGEFTKIHPILSPKCNVS